MVRLLVKEACDALSPPDDAQYRRNDRFVTPTSPHAPIPRSGFVLRPNFGRSKTPVSVVASVAKRTSG